MIDANSTQPDFNPSGLPVVDVIKAKTEELMEFIRENVPDNRQRVRALDNFEDGAMLAVKANFM